MIFVDVYDLKSLPDALEFISQSPNVVSGFETDIKSIGREIPAAISRASRLSVNKILIKLLKNVSSFGYNHANLLSIMTLSVEHFHSTTHVKNMLMTQKIHEIHKRSRIHEIHKSSIETLSSLACLLLY